jgi:fructose-1,6-bisphosphatase/inositol monophosphatase family enzyme
MGPFIQGAFLMKIVNLTEQQPEDVIVEAGIKTVQTAIERIYSELKDNPQALDRLWYEKLHKHLLIVDLVAEREAREFLFASLSKSVEIRGEESSLAPVLNAKVAALLDMLDGSDLLERGLGNWCSALVLFDSKRPKIFTAVVGLPSKIIYYTRHSKKSSVFRRLPQTGTTPIVQKVTMPQRDVTLRDASIAFYGQKPVSLLSWFDKVVLTERLRQIAQDAELAKKMPDSPKLRIYNLAGNPMMISLIEGKVDAVVETRGQHCHDVVPGFTIALRAGAVLQDLKGNDISEADLADKLSDPEHRFRYVLSCNRRLGSELVNALQ